MVTGHAWLICIFIIVNTEQWALNTLPLLFLPKMDFSHFKKIKETWAIFFKLNRNIVVSTILLIKVTYFVSIVFSGDV